MPRIILAAASAISLAAGCALYAETIQAAPVFHGPQGSVLQSNIQDVQFRFGGRRYCWYLAGWRGPGWYWCGYARRRGFGWGGGDGWQGWNSPGRRDNSFRPPMHGGRPGQSPAVVGPRRGAVVPGAVAPGAPSVGGVSATPPAAGRSGAVGPGPGVAGPGANIGGAGRGGGGGGSPGPGAPGGGGDR